MPYTVIFTRSVEVTDPELYINECCIGGDIVLDRLLPTLRAMYGNLQTNQEDWGWFAWFEQGRVKLAVDIFTDDHKAHQFQILLTARKPRLVLSDKVEDGPELDKLREVVVRELTAWSVSELSVQRVGKKYLPA